MEKKYIVMPKEKDAKISAVLDAIKRLPGGVGQALKIVDKVKERLRTPVKVDPTWNTPVGAMINSTSMSPKIDSTVGKELGTAAVALASPAIISAAPTLVPEVAAFEAVNQSPRIFGGDSITGYGGQGAEWMFRKAMPDGEWEDTLAPYVNSAGQFITSIPVGGASHGLLRDARWLYDLTKDAPIKEGVRNLREYRKMLGDEGSIRGGLDYAKDKYSKLADKIDMNYKETALGQPHDKAIDPRLPRFTNTADALKEEPGIFYRSPITGFFFKNNELGRYIPSENNIILNPYHRNMLSAAWKSPSAAIADIDGTLAHEGSHWAIRKLGPGADNLIKPGNTGRRGYYVANPDHPLYNEITWRFADEGRNMNPTGKISKRHQRWMRSPEEYVAEMTKAEYLNGVQPAAPYNTWEADASKNINEFLGKRFLFEPDEASYVTRGLSDFGFNDGGLLLKINKGPR